jgi:ParB family chromosome partitioning protein
MASDSGLGLGKGLANVFERTHRRHAQPEPGPEGSGGSQLINLNLIRPPAANPRQHFDEPALQELADSIQTHGILQPLVVMRKEGGYEVVAGERRFRAAKLLGLPTVPVVVRDDHDPQHLAEVRLVENIQREDLNPIELGQAYQTLIDEHGLTQEELAKRVGKERSSIANTLRLQSLPKGVQDQVVRGTLTMGHAKALLSLAEPQAQREMAQRILDEGLSVRETEKQVRSWGRATRGAAKQQPTHIRELEANLFRLFGAPVKVRESGGKGTITVSFSSKAGFQRVVEILDKTCKDAARTDPKSSS